MYQSWRNLTLLQKLIIHEEYTKEICTLLVICSKSLPDFYGSDKVDFENNYAIRNLWNGSFFKPFKKTRSMCFIGSKTLCYCLVF